MTEKIKDFKLTSYKYPPRHSKTLAEIHHYLRAYDKAQPRFKIPFFKTVNVIELLNPMVRPKFIVPGTILMLGVFISNLYTIGSLINPNYILGNLTASSAIISYVTFMCANIGAALLLPTFIVITSNRINHARAKKKAGSADGNQHPELPNLEKVKNKLVVQLSEDYSPMINGSAEIFGSLKKYITVDQIIAIFNHIFTNDTFDPSPLLDDADEFENGKNEFTKMLQNGLDYGADIGVLEDPKFIQFFSYSFAIGFLKREHLRPNSPYYFSNLDLDDLFKLYQDFCLKFLAYCENEYGKGPSKEHVEDRIFELMDGFVANGKIDLNLALPHLSIPKKNKS